MEKETFRRGRGLRLLLDGILGEGEKAKAMKTEIAGELLRKLSRHSPMIE